MNKQELVAKLYRVTCQLTVPVYELSQLRADAIELLIPVFQELLDYRNNVIQPKDVDDSLVSDMIMLCKMIVKSEKPVSQLRLAQSLLDRLEK